jgi:hypothetical protein
MYSKNTTPGQWRAHGRYISRDSAAKENARHAGFDRNGAEVDIPETLAVWQDAGDERMWKLIISPEFGDKLDMERLTREVMEQVENDLGTRIEWAAVTHHNTDHKHVHVVLRGVDALGKEFRLEPEYVKNGIRGIAEGLATKQLGYRTRADTEEALRREIGQSRYTSLDRSIKQGLQPGGVFSIAPGATQFRDQAIRQRLVVLEQMGIAAPQGRDAWSVREDFEKLLRAAQKANDRQKTLNAHGVTVSDDRLPLGVLDLKKLKAIEGRVLVHGEDEGTGRPYSMIESVDGRLLFVNHTPEIQEARSKGKMRPDSFVRIEKTFVEGKPRLDVKDFGKAAELLNNKHHFAQRVSSKNQNRGCHEWNGWLGRYQAALRTAENGRRNERGR